MSYSECPTLYSWVFYSECPTPYSRVSYSECSTPYSRESYSECSPPYKSALLHIDTIWSPVSHKKPYSGRCTLTWKNSKQRKNISESNFKIFMYLFKTKKVCSIVYCQSFFKAFENSNNTQHGKLPRFLWGSHLRNSIKKVFLKISQNSQENTCVGVSILINLHTSRLQLYHKRSLRHKRFPVNLANFSENLFFSKQLQTNNCLCILQTKIKLLKRNF